MFDVGPSAGVVGNRFFSPPCSERTVEMCKSGAVGTSAAHL